MEFKDKVIVVTGGASGIGAALASQFSALGARVVIIDLNVSEVDDVISIACDVGDEAALSDALSQVETRCGAIDIFVSNAGILGHDSDHAASGSNEIWARCWSVNVMAHVYAARYLLPKMLERGSGYFVTVASAAGLLNQIGDAVYSATKHAAVSFAESLAISHGKAGIGVSLVCPQYVATPMIGVSEENASEWDGLLTADDVARAILDAVSENRFLVLPHAEVREYVLARAQDHDRWIKGMQRLRDRSCVEGTPNPRDFYKLV